VLAALPLQAQSDSITFDPDITDEQFAEFARLLGQGIYATPVEPASARGLLGFDIGVAATAVPIDPAAAYWTQSVGEEDFSISDHVVVPRLVASKGLSFGTISGAYAKVPDSDVAMWGGSLDLPLTRGGIATPTLALRGAYSTIMGVEELDLSTYGVELFLSKGFGPITPYGAVGYAWTKAEGRIDAIDRVLKDDSTMNRYTVGVRLSLLLPKIVIEATQGEERSYAAKISLGL
jgi:hypothetical protein